MRYRSRSSESEEEDYGSRRESTLEEYRRSLSPINRLNQPFNPDYDYDIPHSPSYLHETSAGSRPGSMSPSRTRRASIRMSSSPDRMSRRSARQQEREVHNVQGLAPFFPMMFGDEVPLPEELVNEPYSYEDNGLRPEIVVPRAKFLFTATERGATCVIGSKTIGGTDTTDHAGPRRGEVRAQLQKTTSNVSVVSVYDTYGLEVAYAFLKHLYYHKNDNKHRSWLLTYLTGSLGVLLPELLDNKMLGDEDVLYLSSLMMMALVALDSKQPKMMGSLKTSEVALPPELLGKILGSQRISKQTTSSVRATKCLTIPSHAEMEGRESEPATYSPYVDTYALDFREGFIANELSLTVEGDRFILQHDSRRAVGSPRPTSDIVEYSVYDYVDVMISKGCDRAASLRMILDDISRRFSTVNDRNVNEAAAWLIQLSYDSRGELTPGTLEGYDELRDEIQRLVRMIRLNM